MQRRMPKGDGSLRALLRQRNIRTTKRRLAVLEALARASLPLRAADIHKNAARDMDLVTVYRTLETFLAAGVVREIDLRDAHAYYELVADRGHHHHAVCTQCGAIEDVKLCETLRLEARALKRTRSFASLNEHALEFFGTCKKCT